MRDVFLVFVKAPRPGQVKTRLAAAIGDPLAADLYRAIADRVRRATAPAGAYERFFFFAPADAADEMARWLAGEACVAQVQGDLGARMSAAFEWAFARGARRVVLAGSDVPDLSRAHVAAALAALSTEDVVLGPATDGGYYLVGLRRSCPELFRDMTWSTPRVLADSVDRAGALRLSVAQIEPLADLDDLEGLSAARGDLERWLPADLVGRIRASAAGGR